MLRVKVSVCIFTVAMMAAFLPGCYRMPINQGNRLEQTAIRRLKPGMTREQVRYLMGAPVLQEPFDQSHWNYISRYKTRSGEYKEHRIILEFKGDTLVQVTGGDDVPSAEERDDASEDILPE
ncbi:MAG TPA: outer membrane protein assembly factor BamE [Gammaproteobacteria bacterium]|nr:outer membrane protein assembly factor BamE [Gammaproteobacteria bacterium]